MAFEQMRTFLAGGTQEKLGGVTVLQPDSFPLLLTSELRQEHQTISELIETGGAIRRGSEIRQNATLLQMCATDAVQRTRFCWALIERLFAFDARLAREQGPSRARQGRPTPPYAVFFDYGPAAEAISMLFERGVEPEKVVGPLLEWFTAYRFNYYATPLIERAVEWLGRTYSMDTLPDTYRRLLIALRGQFSDVDYRPAQIEMALDHRTDLLKYPEDQWLEASIDALIGKGPWLVLVPCEPWTAEALQHLNAATPIARENWFHLLKHCHSAASARPGAKWLKEGLALLDAVGAESFVAHVIPWFACSSEGRVQPMLRMAWEDGDERQRMHEVNAALLRGLLWLCPTVAGPELIRAMAKVCFSAFRKIRGLGTRAVKVGNAGVYALGQIDHPLALGQLALLKSKVKLTSAQKAIDRALTLTAQRCGLSREELDEMSVPTYGLTDVGLCEEKVGHFMARLTVIGTQTTELAWINPEGVTRRNVPIAIKVEHAEELKELETLAKEIQKALPIQRDRIDGLFVQQKSWPFSVWRERYLDHPLVGTLARRLIWEFTEPRQKEAGQAGAGQATAGIWHDGHLVDVDLKSLNIESPGATVRLWHPIGRDEDEVAAWQGRLEALQIKQPVKQAHREVYGLEEQDFRTPTWSDRFAGHVLKQHPFHAQCGAREWKHQLLRMAEAEFPPASASLVLPSWGLRAEFSVEGIGSDYGADGADTNENGVYLRVETRQLRFYRIDGPAGAAVEPVQLEEIAPRALSEVMRDVDLFVSTASIGNDPTWFHGGPQNRHRQYWEKYAFGELNGLASTRKVALEHLLPRLRIASQCRMEDRFLVVQGALRTYKIHVGSGNIAMGPDDDLLCMPPMQSDAHEFPVALPFEGDPMVSAIIAKAFLLANDTKITDASIVGQIMRRESSEAAPSVGVEQSSLAATA